MTSKFHSRVFWWEENLKKNKKQVSKKDQWKLKFGDDDQMSKLTSNLKEKAKRDN